MSTVRIVDARIQFDITQGPPTQEQVRNAVSALGVELLTLQQMGCPRGPCSCGGMDGTVTFRSYDIEVADGVPMFNDDAAVDAVMGRPQPMYPAPEPPSIWRRLLTGFASRRT